jgi:hypothetical protein
VDEAEADSIFCLFWLGYQIGRLWVPKKSRDGWAGLNNGQSKNPEISEINPLTDS